MPTVVVIYGWRLFFYSNENNEPVHVHCGKGEAECKYWLDTEIFELREAGARNLTPALNREIRRIIFSNFDLIIEEWNRHFGSSDCADN